MRWWIGLSLLPLAGSAAARGQPAEAMCSRATAGTTTIEAIQADYAAWRGACVRLNGILWGATLLANREALLERRTPYGEEQKLSLHLYGKGRRPIRRPVQVEVTGTIGSCRDHHGAVAALQADDPGSIVTVSGYCHTSLETYVRPVSVRVLSRAPIPRLSEAEVPLTRRELVIAPTDLPRYAEQVEAARAMIDAVARNDVKRFVELDSVEIAGPGEDGVAEQNAQSRARLRAFSGSRRTFAAMRDAGDGRLRVFAERSDIEERQRTPNHVPGLLACWCKTADCEGRGPVIRQDADNLPERPQICVATNQYFIFRGKPVIQAELDIAQGGFAEPRWR